MLHKVRSLLDKAAATTAENPPPAPILDNWRTEGITPVLVEEADTGALSAGLLAAPWRLPG
jgi:hypothetical protein